MDFLFGIKKNTYLNNNNKKYCYELTVKCVTLFINKFFK